MDKFFDDLCRTLATPMSRKRALKLITGGVAGVVLAPFAFGQAKKACSSNSDCSTKCCCAGTCCSPGQSCYGNQICCGAGSIGLVNTANNKAVCAEANNTPTWPKKYTLLGRTC